MAHNKNGIEDKNQKVSYNRSHRMRQTTKSKEFKTRPEKRDKKRKLKDDMRKKKPFMNHQIQIEDVICPTSDDAMRSDTIPKSFLSKKKSEKTKR